MGRKCRNTSYMWSILSLLVIPLLAQAQIPDTLWTRTYGGSEDDYGRTVARTNDGAHVVAGNTDLDTWLLKIDSWGDTIWTRTLYPAIRPTEIQPTEDSGYIITGYSYDAYLIKTDSIGDTLWVQQYGGVLSITNSHSVKQTGDGGYVMVGQTYPYIGDEYGWLVRIDSLGSMISGDAFDGDCGYEVQVTTDSGYIVAGGRYTGVPEGGAYIIKYGSSGLPTWHRIYGGSGSISASAVSVCLTNDDGYALAATVDGGNSVWLLKLDSLGDTLWSRLHVIAPHSRLSVRQTQDSGFIIGMQLGYVNEDIHLLKTDSWGDVLWTNSYGGAGYDLMGSLEICSDAGYIVVGSTNSFGAGGYDVYLLRLAPDTLGIDEYATDVSAERQLGSTILSGSLQVPKGNKCIVYDITGRVVEPKKMTRGIYFVEIDDMIVQKVVKVR